MISFNYHLSTKESKSVCHSAPPYLQTGKAAADFRNNVFIIRAAISK